MQIENTTERRKQVVQKVINYFSNPEIKQLGASYSGKCFYKDSISGVHCAIGCLLSEEGNASLMSKHGFSLWEFSGGCQSISFVVEGDEVFKSFLAEIGCKHEDQEFLNTLQLLHDRSAGYNVLTMNGKKESFVRRLKDLLDEENHETLVYSLKIKSEMESLLLLADIYPAKFEKKELLRR